MTKIKTPSIIQKVKPLLSLVQTLEDLDLKMRPLYKCYHHRHNWFRFVVRPCVWCIIGIDWLIAVLGGGGWEEGAGTLVLCGLWWWWSKTEMQNHRFGRKGRKAHNFIAAPDVQLSKIVTILHCHSLVLPKIITSCNLKKQMVCGLQKNQMLYNVLTLQYSSFQSGFSWYHVQFVIRNLSSLTILLGNKNMFGSQNHSSMVGASVKCCQLIFSASLKSDPKAQ